MTFDDLPIIQCKPGPTDAELEADRNIKRLLRPHPTPGGARMTRTIAAIAAVAVVTAPAAAASPPLVGGNGLCPNAWNLADYIRHTYPGVQSIGGVRADRLPDHPSGHALDIMIGSNLGLGDSIAADVRSQSGRFGVKYVLWKVPQHWNHVHVTVL